MKKNKKIAPSLYSRIRKYQPGGFLSKDWMGRTLTGDSSFDSDTQYIETPFGNMGADKNQGMTKYGTPTESFSSDVGAGDATGGDVAGGASGMGASLIGGAVSSMVDDGSDMHYSGAEIGADAGRLLMGDPTAALDIVKNVLGRGKARKENRLQSTLKGDELTAQQRELTKEEMKTVGNTSADMGNTIDTGEGSYALKAKQGGMRYNLGGVGRDQAYYGGNSGYRGSTFENVEVTEDEYNTLANPGYNVGLYGGTKFHSKGTFKNNPHSADTENQLTTMRGTKENILPREQRLGINPLDQRGAQFADQTSDRIKYRSEEQATYLNDKQMMREQDKRRRFQQGLVNATEDGKEKKYLKNYDRDSKRFEKRGNTESGFRNLMRKIVSPIIPKWGTDYANEDAKFEYGKGYKQGGMKLEGGIMIPIPGSDAVEFKGNRHSEDGIIDDGSEVEHGETKDGVSSEKHGGMQMPYYFSDYVNTDGSKRFGGYSFADAHKQILKQGGSQGQIDALAAAQDKAAGRSSKVAGYAQEGDFKNLSKRDKFRIMQDMGGNFPTSSKDYIEMMNSVEMKQAMLDDYSAKNKPALDSARQDKTNLNILPTIESDSERLDRFVNRDRSKPVTPEMLESVTGPGIEKMRFAKDFKQMGDFTYYDTEASYYGADQDTYQANMYQGPLNETDIANEFLDNNPDLSYQGGNQGLNQNTILGNSTINGTNVNTSGNPTTYNQIENPYKTADKLALASSMIAPIAAYTAKAPQMGAVGDVSAVETPQLKYQKFDRERAINENDFQKVVQFIKTSGGGPSDMINMMAAYDKKMDANAGVTDRQVKSNTNIDNMQAELDMKADTINVGNELSVKQMKQDANKVNIQLQADQQANKIGALETAAANVVTANRDRKAFDATVLMANAIDGGSGVLGRALSPKDQEKAIKDYMEKGIVLNSNEVNSQVNNNPANPQNATQTVQTAIGTDAATAQNVIESNNNMVMANAFLGKNETEHTELLTQIITNYAGTATIDNPSKTAWCAAFTGSILNMNGYEHQGTASARSFATQGTEVAAGDYQVGDVVVMWRDPKGNYTDNVAARKRSDNANTGHVGFYAGTDDDGNILVLGGNQGTTGGGAVTEASFSADRVLGVRRFS